MKARSPRARGLRTLQHQTLPAAICFAIDTEVWFRGMTAARAGGDGAERRWATKDQVHDEAVAWFLEQHATLPVQARPERRGGYQDLTFWVDSKLLQRARRMAGRNGLKLARLIQLALADYVKQHIPEALLAFRRRTQREASRLYKAKHQRKRLAQGRSARPLLKPALKVNRR